MVPTLVVTHRLGGSHGTIAHSLPKFGREHRTGRLLDELLVPALNRAVALAQVNDIAVLVGHDLDFDVGAVTELFDVDFGIAEPGLRLGTAAAKALAVMRGNAPPSFRGRHRRPLP
jgi:hypothetical protein